MALHVRLKLQFPQVKVLILGIFLALLGLACIVMGIVAFTKRVWGHYVATGLWGGTMIFATGTCAIIASQLRTPCSVKSYLVCSVFGIIISFVMIVLSSGGLDYNSRFYNFAYFAHKKRHTATMLVHATTLILSLLSFVGNIVSLIVCLKYIVYDRHQPVCETKVKRSSARPVHKNASRSNSDSRVPLTGCHRSQRHNSRSKKNGTVSTRDPSRGERRSSDGSRHSHRHRRKNEQCAPSRGSRRRNHHATRSSIEYENITNDNILQQRQQSSCTEHYEVDLLPTAFDEEELPPYEPAYEPHSVENVNILPPNIPPDDVQRRQVEQTENRWSDSIKPPGTPPSLDPEVRALFLANHELADNLDSIHSRKPSTEKSNKIVCKILKETQSDEVHAMCNSDISNSLSNSVGHDKSSSGHQSASATVSHPLSTSLLSDKVIVCENVYENINSLARCPAATGSRENSSVGKPLQMCSPSEPNRSTSFDSPAFHLRLEPEGRQDNEEKEDVIKLFSNIDRKPSDNLLESHSDDNTIDHNTKFLPSLSSHVPRTSVDSFHVPEDIEFADSQSTKDLNMPPLKPMKIGSPTSAFHLYDGQNSVKSTENKPLVLSGMSDSFGGARPKYTNNILPLNLGNISPESTCNIQRQSSWKEFLLPSPHNKEKLGQTPSSVNNDIASNASSVNSTKGKTFKFAEPPTKTGLTPPVFIPPASLKLKKTTQSNPLSSSGPARPITSLHPRYHQPFSSDLSLFSQPHPPASTAVTCSIQPPLLCNDNGLHSSSDNRPEQKNASANLPVEPVDLQVQVRPSLIGGEVSPRQPSQAGPRQPSQAGPRQPSQDDPRPPSQDGSRQPPLFSVLL